MKNISIITIHPEFINSYKKFGVFSSAEKNNLTKITPLNLRDFANDNHGTVDNRPYGGGDGMVMRVDVLAKAIRSIPNNPCVIAPSPRGSKWSQKYANYFAKLERPIVFVCGRFGGIDERFYDKFVDYEYSLGDFIISGGELASLTMVDSILRQVPGVLGHNDSAYYDSFSEGLNNKLEHQLYTKPELFEDQKIPEVLKSGNHKNINNWKKTNSDIITKKYRSDL